jgi:hypothetical protein
MVTIRRRNPAPAVVAVPGKWIMTDIAGIGPKESAGLLDVAAIGATDAWAVGFVQSSPLDKERGNLAVRWNGRTWQRVDIPAGGGLSRVVAVAADDVWTVGTSASASDGGFIAHWDGHRWTQVATPRPDGLPIGPVTLNGISVRSATDIWAVGCAAGYLVVQHWDGRNWRVSPASAAPTGYNACLNAVAALAGDDVWAVGGVPGEQHSLTPFAMRWNGEQWSAVQTAGPLGPAHYGTFDRIIALSPNDVWMFGGWVEFAQHWDGKQWHHISVPTGIEFQATAAAPDGNGGLVASTVRGSKTLNLLRWNGTAWTAGSGPTLGGQGQQVITGLDASSGRLWAVGFAAEGTTSHPFAALTALR